MGDNVNQIVIPDPMLAPKGTLEGGDDKAQLASIVKQIREKLNLRPAPPPEGGLLQHRVIDGEQCEHYRIARAYYSTFGWFRPKEAKVMNERPPFPGNSKANPGLVHIINFAWRYS